MPQGGTAGRNTGGGANAVRALSALAALCAAFALSGCMETAATAPPMAPDSKIAARPGVSPQGASVALIAVDGAPDAATARFMDVFGSIARARQVVTVEPAAAAYLVRGYLTASADAPGTVRLAYVFDVFDRRKQRASRIASDFSVPMRGADPWAAADERTLSALAAQAAQDLADVLTNTPEAIAAARAPATPAVARGKTPSSRIANAAAAGSSVFARIAPPPAPAAASSSQLGYADAQ